MAWFLFIDESGHDRLASPYEVLAGVAIRDQVLRELIARLHDAEVASFGRRYSDGHRELKGAVLLKRKVFRHRALSAELDLADLPSLARAALDDGARANARMLLIDQMHRYFEETALGRHRASRIIPEPFFVHSDLTTGVQIADLLAYVISWRFRQANCPVALPGRTGEVRQPRIQNLELRAHRRPADPSRTRRRLASK